MKHTTIRVGTSMVIGMAAILGASAAMAAGAATRHPGSANYENCVAQKEKVAKTYCSNAGKDCQDELAAARSECRLEVRRGLSFKRS